MKRISSGIAAVLSVWVLVQPSRGSANDQWTQCIPTEVGVFTDRLHVKCQSPVYDSTTGNYIYYFAVSASSSNQPFGDRFLSTATTAYISARPLAITWAQGSATNPPNCGATDCRLARSVTIQ